MANLSDAHGTLRVKKVGKEFVKFLMKVQGEESSAYYTLVDPYELKSMLELVDEDGDLETTFYASGRWSFESNLDGYLGGGWLQGENDKPHYDKFIAQLTKKKGEVDFEYEDSDPAMDWMGEGGYTLNIVDGELNHSHIFESRPCTIVDFAEANGESQYWALEYLYGDDVAGEYDKYVEDWKKTHEFKEGESEPACPAEWYDHEYQLTLEEAKV